MQTLRQLYVTAIGRTRQRRTRLTLGLGAIAALGFFLGLVCPSEALLVGATLATLGIVAVGVVVQVLDRPKPKNGGSEERVQ